MLCFISSAATRVCPAFFIRDRAQAPMGVSEYVCRELKREKREKPISTNLSGGGLLDVSHVPP